MAQSIVRSTKKHIRPSMKDIKTSEKKRKSKRGHYKTDEVVALMKKSYEAGYFGSTDLSEEEVNRILLEFNG